MKALILVFATLGGFSVASAAGTTRPNIIVFYTDDHGFADLGIQGSVADIKKTIAQGPPKGAGRPGGPSGPPPGGSSDTTGTTKTYDFKDTNQDGKVSTQEEQAYVAKRALEAQNSSTDENSQVSGRSFEAWA